MTIIIIIATIIIVIFLSYSLNVVFDVRKKENQVVQIGGMPNWAMAESKTNLLMSSLTLETGDLGLDLPLPVLGLSLLTRLIKMVTFRTIENNKLALTLGSICNYCNVWYDHFLRPAAELLEKIDWFGPLQNSGGLALSNNFITLSQAFFEQSCPKGARVNNCLQIYLEDF